MIEEEKKKKFTLPNEKVKVVPIRRKGGWLNNLHPNHEASFLVSRAGKKYAAPLAGKNRIATVLTNEEREYLEKVLDRDLNPYKEFATNYWVKRFVRLTREITVLDLSDPDDFISYKILLLHKDEIVEGGDNRYKKGTYKFFIDSLEYEDKRRSKAATAKKDAYKHFGQLSSQGKTAMSDFLTVYYQNRPGKKIPEGATIELLEGTLDKIIEEDIDGFLFIAGDPEYKNKVFITNALRARALLKEDGKYYLPEGTIIANNLEDLVLWIKDPINSDEVLQIQARIDK